jgi:hypothetical protein
LIRTKLDDTGETSMPAQLRPMKLGEILDQAIAMYRRRIWLFAVPAMIPCLGMLSLRLANEFWWKLQPPHLAHLFGFFNIGLPLFLLGMFQIRSLLGWIAYPALIRLACAEPGDVVNIRSARQDWGKRWKQNIGLLGVQYLVVLFLPEFTGFALFCLAGFLESELQLDTSHFGPVFAPTFLLAMAAGIVGYFWLTGCFSFAWPAACFEGFNVRKSMGRGWRLSRGVRWQVSIARAFPAVIWWVLTITIAMLAQSVFVAMRLNSLLQSRGLILITVIYILFTFVIDIFLAPVFPIALALLYRDQRVRKEGYDVERMMEAAGLVAPVENAATDAPPEPIAVQTVSQAVPPPAVDDPNTQPAGESIA